MHNITGGVAYAKVACVQHCHAGAPTEELVGNLVDNHAREGEQCHQLAHETLWFAVGEALDLKNDL